MSEMVERLAEVIYKKAVEHDYDPNHCIPEARKVYRDIARAAILAMREPTEAFIVAYYANENAPHGAAEYGLKKYHARFLQDVLRAIVDAALAEKKP